MALENIHTAEAWMDNHPVEYDRLFDDGALESQASEIIAQLPHIEPESLPLSFLARHNTIRKRLRHDQSRLISRGVLRILTASYEGNLGDSSAFLSDLSQQDLLNTSRMTAQVIFAWQRGCKQYRMPSPFRDLYDSHTDIPLDTIERPPIILVLIGCCGFAFV